MFRGDTINTPSMLAVEDALDGLRWAERIGGLSALIARSEDNLRIVAEWVERTPWVDFLAERPERSPTSICLKVVDPEITALPRAGQAALIKHWSPGSSGVAYDIASYRDAPPGLRLWGGATVESADLEALLPRLDWAYREARSAYLGGPMRCIPEDEETIRMARVLIADELSPAAVAVLEDRGILVDVRTGLAEADPRVIGDYDGLAVRSATKVTARVLEAAGNLKVIGRAGIGVDNIDLGGGDQPGRGGDEHAVRQFGDHGRAHAGPDAGARAPGARRRPFHQGRQMGEGALRRHRAGRQGARPDRLRQHRRDRGRPGPGLKMRVIAYDPYLAPERALDLGVERVSFDDLLARADIISLHAPLTESTRNLLDRDALARTKPGVRIVNCARGGLIDEAALYDAIQSGHVAGAALDVFAEEPARSSPLFELEEVGDAASRRLDGRGAGEGGGADRRRSPTT